MSFRSAACLPAAALLALFVAAAPALAIPIVITSQAAWLGVVSGVQIEDFEASTPGVLAPGSTDIGLFNVFIVDPGPGPINTAIRNAGFVNGSRELDVFPLGPAANIARFDFDTPIKAWSGDFFSTTSGNLLTVTVNGITFQFRNYLPAPGTGFLGVVDSAGFNSITFDRENPTSFGEFWGVDNFRIAADAQSIPAPATLALIGLGIACLGCRRRREQGSVYPRITTPSRRTAFASNSYSA